MLGSVLYRERHQCDMHPLRGVVRLGQLGRSCRVNSAATLKWLLSNSETAPNKSPATQIVASSSRNCRRSCRVNSRAVSHASFRTTSKPL